MNINIEKFAKSALFSGIALEKIGQLTRKFPRRTFKKGTVILEQGKRIQTVYLLLEGKVAIQSLSPLGTETTVLYHYAPFIFGEIEILDQAPSAANVISLTPCTVMELSRTDYLQLLQSSHQLCVNIIRILSRLLQKAAEDRKIRFFGKVENLTAKAIWNFARLEGLEKEEGILIPSKINKSKFAIHLGISRKSIVKAFACLEKEGLIVVENRKIFVPSMKKLLLKAQA